jgi:hypothetical protein
MHFSLSWRGCPCNELYGFVVCFLLLNVRTNVPPQLDIQAEALVSKRVCLLALGLRVITIAIKQ